MERRNFEVPRAHGGEAVARILHDGMGVAHSIAKGLIDEGCVTINGRAVRTHGQRCQTGDVVEVRFDPDRRYRPMPEPRHGPGFRVVHEDREIVVVNKMPGILSTPAPGVGEESLAERIAASLRERGIKKPQLFVVHRLDRHTSGLLVFAKTQRALESLTAQFESHEAGRIYTAVVVGRVQKDAGTIISHLVEDPRSLSVRSTPLRGAGKRAVTHFQVIERLPAATIVRCRLETGRKHQIRIHLAEIGHPVLGDRRYGGPSSLIPRVALHAEVLAFRHPVGLARVSCEAPWPDDLTRLAHVLRKGAGVDPAREQDGIAPFAASPLAGPGEPGRDAPRVVVFPKGLVLLDPLAPVEKPVTPPSARPVPRVDARTMPASPAAQARTGQGGGSVRPAGGAQIVRRPTARRDTERRFPAAKETAGRGPANPLQGAAAGDRERKGLGNRPEDAEARRRLAMQRAVVNRSSFRRPRPEGGRPRDTIPREQRAERDGVPAPRLDSRGGHPGQGGDHREPRGKNLEPRGDHREARGAPLEPRGDGREPRGAPRDARRVLREPRGERPASEREPRDPRGRGVAPEEIRKRNQERTDRIAKKMVQTLNRDVLREEATLRTHGPRSAERKEGFKKGSKGGIRKGAEGGDKQGAPPSSQRKPWEFKQKGMTLRRERRRKIAAAKSKSKNKRKG